MVRRRSASATAPFPFADLSVAILGYLALSATSVVALPLGLRPALFLAEIALAAPALVLMRQGAGAPALHERRAGAGLVLLALGGGAALWLLSLGLMDLQARLWLPPAGYLESFRRLHALLRPSGAADALLSLGVIALMPALCEELVFRGLLLPAFARWRGALTGLAVSSLLFGLIHVDPAAGGLTFYRVPFAMVVGLGFGLLRLRAGTLLAPMLAHAALNALTFGAVPLLDEPSPDSPFPHPAVGAAVGLAGALALAWVLRGLHTTAPSAIPGRAARRPV